MSEVEVTEIIGHVCMLYSIVAYESFIVEDSCIIDKNIQMVKIFLDI